MIRRRFSLASISVLTVLAAAGLRAHARGVSDLSTTDASQGVTTALERGAVSAVSLLGKADGFLGNPKVRIPLPGLLNDAAKFLRTIGQGKKLDELITAMNRAAEAAVPMSRQLLIDAVRNISFTDAKKILMGGETSVTAFFAEKTRVPLSEKFLPTVTEATNKVGVAEKYNKLASKAAGMGLGKKEDASIEHYVTRKALDGLYFMIGEEEKKIRQDPIGSGSAILQKVFGSLK